MADTEARTFTYAVPDRLAGRLQPGHLVWVPFRGRRLQAVVLDLSDAAPTFDTREILSLVWAQPALTPSQISLAHWISSYYLAPLIEALRLMLPAGLSQRGRTVLVRTTKPVPGNLTSTQAAVLARVAQAEGEWAEITEGLRGITQAADLEPLIAAGLITREVAFATPPPRPKTDRLVRLLADADTVARLLPTLGHASKQADVLAQVARQPGPTPLDELCAAVGCGRGPVEALAQRGWVTIAKAAAKAPALVGLALAGDTVLAALLELRGAEKHRAVLEALQRAGGAAWIGWVYAETGATLATLRDLEAAGLATIAEEMVWRDPLAGYEFALDQPPVLTEDQERVWESIRQWIEEDQDLRTRPIPLSATNPQSPIYLLHGVTGSGKTEIYLRAIAEALKRGQQAVALVPEIALTPQTIRRFAARFPGKVTVWHSELGEGERFDVWRRVRTNHAASQVVVGSRSALFLPFPNLGLIVLDEEHEPSYKQERTPRYHARTAALELGRLCTAPVILGSATPTLETYYAAQRGEIALLGLPKRILGHQAAVDRPAAGDRGQLSLAVNHPAAELPPVQVVDMRQELRAGNRGVFSRPLVAEMGHVLAAGQQVMLYLNRRGASTFVMCRDCGHVEACPRCAVPLTLHRAGELLLCHHCNRRYPAPTVCQRVPEQAHPSLRCRHRDYRRSGEAGLSRGAHPAVGSRCDRRQRQPRRHPEPLHRARGGCAHRHADDRQGA